MGRAASDTPASSYGLRKPSGWSSRLIEMPAQLRSDGVESTSVRHWQAVQRVRIDARRLTFHDVGIERLRSVIDDAAGHGQDQH